MEIIIEKGEHENRIKTLDNWLQFAPPKDSKRQWKPGRSAKLFAQFAISLKSATLLKSQSVAAQTAKNAIFLVWTDFLPCVG